MSSKKNTSIVWFRNNLRVEDNSALYNAVNQSDRVIGYINIDPNNFKLTQYGFKKTEKYRAKFLLESISDLKQNLNHLNISLIIDFKEIKESFISFYLFDLAPNTFAYFIDFFPSLEFILENDENKKLTT